MEFKIENTEVYGVERAVVNSGNSFRTKLRTKEDINDKDWARCQKLGCVEPGSGHDSFLNGCLVTMDVIAPLYWWKQAQRYHWLEFISSQSTMHCLAKFKLTDQCTLDTDQEIINICQKIVNKYNHMIEVSKINPNIFTKEDINRQWRKMIASLPCGFCLGATMTTNYRQLKTICKQRQGHPLKEWSVFIEWCCNLPYFSELTGIK